MGNYFNPKPTKLPMQASDNLTCGTESDWLTFVCISDTHSQQYKMAPLPEGDVLLHSGDFSQKGYPQEISDFSHWLGQQNFKHKVVICGNHEITFDLKMEEPLSKQFQMESINFAQTKALLKNCIYLEETSVIIDGIKIYGYPQTPTFYDWGFNSGPEELKDLSEAVPEDSDIVLIHGPPHNILDGCADGYHAGCKSGRKNL
jgi:hypothetical protein